MDILTKSKPIIFVFYKENRIDGKYELTTQKIKKAFKEWMESKKIIWLESYYLQLVNAFISEKGNGGLNSVIESMDDQRKLTAILEEVKRETFSNLKYGK